MRGATIVHGNVRYDITVHSIPRTGHTLRLLPRGAAEAIVLEVMTVLYEVGANGRTGAVELRVRRGNSSAVLVGDIVSRFWAEVEWVSRTMPPCIGDSVRLRTVGAGNLAKLQVWDVIHEIDQAGKKQVIKVRVVDASPKQVFSDEVIRRAEREDIEPLLTD